MNERRAIRELALQALYQYDVRGEADVEQIERSVMDAPGDIGAKRQAIALARQAWAAHDRADACSAPFTDDWPTHRQPVIDRNIIRLGYYELITGAAPVAVVINEAIELAKAFGSEHSASFINGVLDPIARQLAAGGAAASPAQAPPSTSGDAWLSDAIDNARPTP